MRSERISGVLKPLPRIIVGTASLGSVLPDALVSRSARQQTFARLDALLELGCTALDTAAVYQAGGTERLLGEWLASRGVRERVFLISKCGHPSLLLGTPRFRPADLAADLHDSLRRLRTETIELYLLHRDAPSLPMEPVIDALAGFQKAGKILAYGVSNWTSARVEAAQQFAAKQALPPIAASSPHFSLLEWARPPWSGCVSLAGAQTEARAFYARTRLPVLAWSPLGGGFFADAAAYQRSLGTYGLPVNFARKERTEALARKKGVSAAQVALAWLFQQPFPVCAVVAATSPEKMRRNLEATELALSPAELGWLESGGELD